jgi:flap endonuclease-1
MGIKGLMKLLSDHAPASIKEREIKNYFNRVVAIDASMSLYQFLIAIRSGPEAEVLTNEAGEVTSHLQGMFYRTIRMLDNGIKPVFVFGQHKPAARLNCCCLSLTSLLSLSCAHRRQGSDAQDRRSGNTHTA